MISAKDIVIAAPLPPPADTLPDDVSDAEINAIFRDLRDLIQVCGTNKHDIVDVLITALIDRGITSGPRIIGAVKRLDFNGRHAGRRLSDGIGHRWSRDDDGTYHNLM